MANWLVLDEAWDGIKAHPDLHDQRFWFASINEAGDPVGRQSEVTQERMPACGTKSCLAGWIIHQQAPAGTIFRSSLRNPQLAMPDGSSHFVSTWARHAAELTYDQAEALFYCTKGTRDLRAMLDYLRQHDDASHADLIRVGRKAGEIDD